METFRIQCLLRQPPFDKFREGVRPMICHGEPVEPWPATLSGCPSSRNVCSTWIRRGRSSIYRRWQGDKGLSCTGMAGRHVLPHPEQGRADGALLCVSQIPLHDDHFYGDPQYAWDDYIHRSITHRKKRRAA